MTASFLAWVTGWMVNPSLDTKEKMGFGEKQ